MKNATVCAVIGSVFYLLAVVWSIIAQFVGWRYLHEMMPDLVLAMSWFQSIAHFIASISYLCFFVSILKRQK